MNTEIDYKVFVAIPNFQVFYKVGMRTICSTERKKKKKKKGVPQQIQVQRDGQYGTAQSKHLNPVDCTSFSPDKEQCLQHSYQIKSRICTPPRSKRVLKQINVKNVFPFFLKKKRASESEILSPLNLTPFMPGLRHVYRASASSKLEFENRMVSQCHHYKDPF